MITTWITDHLARLLKDLDLKSKLIFYIQNTLSKTRFNLTAKKFLKFRNKTSTAIENDRKPCPGAVIANNGLAKVSRGGRKRDITLETGDHSTDSWQVPTTTTTQHVRYKLTVRRCQ